MFNSTVGHKILSPIPDHRTRIAGPGLEMIVNGMFTPLHHPSRGFQHLKPADKIRGFPTSMEEECTYRQESYDYQDA